MAKSNTFKTIISTLLLSSLLLITSCQSTEPDSQSNQTDKSQANSQEKGQKVNVFTVSKDIEVQTPPSDLPSKLGIVESAQKVSIKAEVAGKITAFTFREGDQIDEDQAIAFLGSSLNTDLQEINFKNALVSLKNAEEQLAAKKEANQKALANAQISIETAQVQLNSAYQNAENIGRTTSLNIDHLRENEYESYYNLNQASDNSSSTQNSNSNSSSYNNYQPDSYYESYYSDDSGTERQAIKKSANETTSPSSGQSPNTDAQYRSTYIQTRQGIEKAQDGYINQITGAQTQIEQAQLQLKNAVQQLDLKQTQIQLEEQQLQDQIEQLAGQADIAKRNLEAREIKAPIKGTFLKKLVEEGELVSPGQAIAEIGKIGILKIQVSITQNELKNYKELQPVTVITPTSESIPAIITKIPTTFDQKTKTGIIEIEVENPDQALKPGMIASVVFAPIETLQENFSSKQLSGIWIPLNTVYFRNETYVFLAKNGKTKQQLIETGKISGNMIEVTKGIKDKDQVILDRYGIEDNIDIVVQSSPTKEQNKEQNDEVRGNTNDQKTK